MKILTHYLIIGILALGLNLFACSNVIFAEEAHEPMEEEMLQEQEEHHEPTEEEMLADQKKWEEEVQRVLKEHGDKGLLLMAILSKMDLYSQMENRDKVIEEARKIIELDLSDRFTTEAFFHIVGIYEDMGKADLIINEAWDVYGKTKSRKLKIEAISVIVEQHKAAGNPEKAIEALDKVENDLQIK